MSRKVGESWIENEVRGLQKNEAVGGSEGWLIFLGKEETEKKKKKKLVFEGVQK